MKLEDQVAPLALAQRMKELGFPQETLFGWVVPGGNAENNVQFRNQDYLAPEDFSCAAPTVAEMGEWLEQAPRAEGVELMQGFDESNRSGWWCGVNDRGGGGHIAIRAKQGYGGDAWMFGATAAEACSVVLVALAESGSLDPRRLR